ncbi:MULTISPECIES: YlxR family protein [unclassified Adlercreutzia]|uniref:YlxR family protein n=1 Tax=unclassified Adlercreutzia TaxID=2636013 RepID=UPI0013EA872A|nr:MULTISPECIES: YlxR family protein [unclassified Adlercreutzia]
MDVQKRVRTCISCGAKSDKTLLYRIVRASDGSTSFDSTGRAAGRGAYVCSWACYVEAARKGKLDKALKTKVSQEDYGRIGAELAAVCGDSEA